MTAYIEHASLKVRDIEIIPNGMAGMLAIPAEARALVVFAHGSGSSRFSPGIAL